MSDIDEYCAMRDLLTELRARGSAVCICLALSTAGLRPNACHEGLRVADMVGRNPVAAATRF